MPDVKLTVLMPAWNAEKFIAEAITSVLKQTFRDFELLIVNDGSTDNTLSEIKKVNDPRIRVIQQEHRGIATSLNNGLKEARGIYIARFDADDLCNPERLEKQFYFLAKNPDYVVVGSDAEYIAENGEHLFDFSCIGHTHREIMQKLYSGCPFIHSGVMYRRDAVMNAGGYSADACSFEDYFLWTQLTGYGKYHNLGEKLIRVRFNPYSTTIDEK